MSGGQAQKKQSFLQGVAVLTAATIIVKLLGFIYKVPLQNILQERGFGYFNTATCSLPNRAQTPVSGRMSSILQMFFHWLMRFPPPE